MTSVRTLELNGVSISESHPENTPQDGDLSYRVINYLDEPDGGHPALPVFEVYEAKWEWRTYDGNRGPVSCLERGDWKFAYAGGCPDGEISLERALEEYRRHQQYREEITGTVKKVPSYDDEGLRTDVLEELDQLF